MRWFREKLDGWEGWLGKKGSLLNLEEFFLAFPSPVRFTITGSAVFQSPIQLSYLLFFFKTYHLSTTFQNHSKVDPVLLSKLLDYHNLFLS